MEVICIEDAALYLLIDQVVERIKDKNSKRDRWITPDEAMQKLNIKSTSTLQKYRDEGKIRYSQRDRWHILYDVESIDAFIEENARETF